MLTRDDSASDRVPRTERLALRGLFLVLGALALSAVVGWSQRARAVDEAQIDPAPTLREQLDGARGELAMARVQLQRTQTILDYSTKYQIPADLSAAIYDIALSEGIDPALAFRLVKVESNFKRYARSSAAAFGYAQMQLATARFYDPDITERELYDPETNLRLGFRYLKDLLEKFDNDMHLALLAYNRGPGRVTRILAAGGDPGNGYARAVLRGYHPMSSIAQVD